MEVVVNLLIWLHFLSLAVGGVATFGIPIVGSKLGGAPAEARPPLFRIMKQMSMAGRAALVVLLVTGPLIFWLRYSGVAPNFWFWVKMLLVLLMVVLVVAAGVNAKRAEGGDIAAAKRAPQLGAAAMVTYAVLILSAALAFG
jgi:hypothetical protein